MLKTQKYTDPLLYPHRLTKLPYQLFTLQANLRRFFTQILTISNHLLENFKFKVLPTGTDSTFCCDCKFCSKNKTNLKQHTGQSPYP